MREVRSLSISHELVGNPLARFRKHCTL